MQHGYTVLPDRPLPLAADEVEAAVREDLDRCRLSIHMVGRTYSMVPGGGWPRSPSCRTSSRSSARRKEQFSRLIWIPPGLQVDDVRQRLVLDRLRMDPRMGKGADLLETPLEDLRTMIRRLAEENRDAGASGRRPRRLYTPAAICICSTTSATPTPSRPWADCLFKDFEVIHPGFDGSEPEMADVSRREPAQLPRRPDFLRLGRRAVAAGETARAAEVRRLPRRRDAAPRPASA